MSVPSPLAGVPGLGKLLSCSLLFTPSRPCIGSTLALESDRGVIALPALCKVGGLLHSLLHLGCLRRRSSQPETINCLELSTKTAKPCAGEAGKYPKAKD
eukprot:3218287-Amphidinium_carterae.3